MDEVNESINRPTLEQSRVIEQQCEAYFKMFRTPGWKQFTALAQQDIPNIQAIAFSEKDKDKYLVACGKVEVLTWMTAFESTVERNYEGIQEHISDLLENGEMGEESETNELEE